MTYVLPCIAVGIISFIGINTQYSHEENKQQIQNNLQPDPLKNLRQITLAMRSNSPYNKGQMHAAVYERVAAALQSMDYHLEIIEYPWKRAQIYTELNKVDGFFPASLNSKRSSKFAHTATINTGYMYWITLPESTQYFKKITANELSVGVIRGTAAAQWAKDHNYSIIEISDHISLMNMLKNKRLQCILTSMENLSDYFNSHPRYTYESAIAYERHQYLFLSRVFVKAHPDFLTNFNQALQKID